MSEETSKPSFPKPNNSTLSQSCPRYRRHVFVPKEPNSFGNTTPKWTIPSSRHQMRKTDDNPAPGQYDIFSSEQVTRGHTIQSRHEIRSDSITTNLDYDIDNCDSRSCGPTIGRRDRIIIGETYKKRVPDPVPSPTRYNPYEYLHDQVPTISLEKSISHPTTISNDNGNPGPGSYQLEKAPVAYSNWTERIRVRSTRWKPPPDPRVRPWQVPALLKPLKNPVVKK